MLRLLKWIGYLVGALVLVIVVGVGVVYAVTSSRMGKTYSTTVEPVAVPTDSESIARGRHLTEAVGKCQECHGDSYAGKFAFDAPVFARLTAPNLTSGKDGIGGTYTDLDWVRTLRYGLGRDNKPLIFMPSEAYTNL
ncbi:MAG: cytochrome c, partial [Gemmatimonadaceae bacterium]